MKRMVKLMRFVFGATVIFSPPAFSQSAPMVEECTAPDFSAGASGIEPGVGARPLAEAQGEVLLRIGPSFRCDSKYLVPAGGTVELQECKEDWCLVAYGNEIGYLPVFALDRMPDRASTVDGE